jgi:hypothetical protein
VHESNHGVYGIIQNSKQGNTASCSPDQLDKAILMYNVPLAAIVHIELSDSSPQLPQVLRLSVMLGKMDLQIDNTR